MNSGNSDSFPKQSGGSQAGGFDIDSDSEEFEGAQMAGGKKKSGKKYESNTSESEEEDNIPSLVPSQNSEPVQLNSHGYAYNEAIVLPMEAQHRVKQCTFCSKYFNKGTQDVKTKLHHGGMITNEYDANGDSVCYHCIFMIHYNPIESRVNFDGAFGKTIVEYILECKDSHNAEECNHRTECFVCDFLANKDIEGVFGLETMRPTPETVIDDNEYDICI
jgi:hypothetical protein